MRMQQTENQGVGGEGGSTPRDTCRASLKLAPKRCPKFPVPLYIGTYSVPGTLSYSMIKANLYLHAPPICEWEGQAVYDEAIHLGGFPL